MEQSGKGSVFFGGADPLEIAEAVGNGYAAWIDTDGRDAELVTCQGAGVVNAPVETVFDTALDFERRHEYMRMSRKCKIYQRDGADKFEVNLKQKSGFSFLSFGFEMKMRFAVDRPRAAYGEYISGPFKQVDFEMFFHPLEDGRTLFVVSFLAELRALGWITRFFFKHQPEFEFPMNAGLPLLSLHAIGAEAERRSGRGRSESAEPPPQLSQFLIDGKLRPAVEHGYLTVCRVDRRFETLDVASACRVGAPQQPIWDICADPGKLCKLVDMMHSGRVISKDAKHLKVELTAQVRFSIFGKKYHIKGLSNYEEPVWFDCFEAQADDHPCVIGDNFIADGANTIFCKKFYMDPKRDWLSRKFLGSHPELEQLINCFPPLIEVRAIRRHFGPPK